MARLFWLPLIAVLLHILEEFVWPGGFLAWDRQYRAAIAGSISPRFAVVANSLLVGVALLTGLVGPATSSSASLWLILMAALAGNAVFHLNAVLRTRRYSPGVVTATLCYLPLCVGGYIYFLRSGFTSPRVALTSIVLGASYNFWSPLIHQRRAAAVPQLGVSSESAVKRESCLLGLWAEEFAERVVETPKLQATRAKLVCDAGVRAWLRVRVCRVCG